MPVMGLEEEWANLKAETDSARRGHQFEAFVAALLRTEHFDIERDLRANRRQVDLFASRGDLHLLVEVKWTQGRTGLPDIDSLFTRLETAAPSVVGVLVSWSGFVPAVIERVRAKSGRPVLLVSGKEIESILAGATTAKKLFDQKLNRITKHQQVSLNEERRGLPASAGQFPVPRAQIVTPDGTELLFWKGQGGFDPIAFVLEQADIDWVLSGGTGVSLDLDVPTLDQSELVGLFYELARLGWISPSGTWRILQSNMTWMGMGAAQLVRELDRRHVTGCRLSFQLSGIPLDIAPLKGLADSLGASPPFFRPRDHASVVRRRFDRMHGPLDAIAYVVESMNSADDVRENWVVGVILEDPLEVFHGTQRTELGLPPESLGSWLCYLDSAHPLSERRKYQIGRIESAWTSDVHVLLAHADWAN